MTEEIPKDALNVAAKLSKEEGIPLDNILYEHFKKMKDGMLEIACESGRDILEGLRIK